MIPFFVVYRKQAIPYFAALLSHILIGDFFTGGIQLFWPVSHNLFGALNLEVNSIPIALTELVLFLLTVPLMFKLGARVIGGRVYRALAASETHWLGCAVIAARQTLAHAARSLVFFKRRMALYWNNAASS